MLSLQELEIFLMAAKYGNFSETGRILHLSQPAISQTIHNLEVYFGTELFMRHGRGVRLSDAGETLLPMAQDIVTAVRRMEENMAMVHGQVVGKVTVGCSTSSGKYLMPQRIARFREMFPSVQVDVLIRRRGQMFDDLLSNQLHFGVTSRQIHHHDLEYTPLYHDEVALLVPADHPWATYGRVFPDDLVDKPMIMREEGAGTRDALATSLLEHDITLDMLNVVMVLGHAEAITLAVAEGVGVAFVSRMAAAPYLALGQVVEVAVEGMNVQHDLYFARNKRSALTRSQLEFWNHMNQQTPVADVAPLVDVHNYSKALKEPQL